MTAKTLEQEDDLQFHINRAEYWLKERVLLGDQKETVFALMVASRMLLRSEKEIEELRAKLASMREPIWMLREEHDQEIEELRAKLEEVPVVEIRTSIEYALSLPSDYEELKAAETVVRWLATVTK